VLLLILKVFCRTFVLPPQFIRLSSMTSVPFAQLLTQLRATFIYDGRIVLVLGISGASPTGKRRCKCGRVDYSVQYKYSLTVSILVKCIKSSLRVFQRIIIIIIVWFQISSMLRC